MTSSGSDLEANGYANDSLEKMDNNGPETMVNIQPLRQRAKDDGTPDLQPEEEHLRRSLSSRQASMLALGGAIGTGLIVGTGSGLANSGPVSLLLAYIFVGSLCFGMLSSMCEMAAYLPHQRGFIGHATRFVGPSFGASTGIAYWLKYLIQAPTQFSAGALVINYWIPARKVDDAVWIAIFIVLTGMVQLLPVRVFGEFEFWCSTFKVVVLTGLMIMALCIDAGGDPTHQYIGFRTIIKTWKELPFAAYLEKGSLGRFIGFWYAVTTAIYSFAGSEMVGVAVGEMKNPSRSISRAVRACFYRIVFLYCGSVFCIGLVVPGNSKLLLTANKSSTNANASPFVVATEIAGIKGLNHVINAAILIFVFSAASSDTYTSSRTAYTLADEGNLPKIFRRTNRFGTPYVAVCFSLLTACLGFTVARTSAYVVFQYFVSTVTLLATIVWTQIMFSNLRFRSALKRQGISLKTLPYTSRFNPWLCYWGIFGMVLIIFTKGFTSFIHKFNYKTFITNYIALPVIPAVYVLFSTIKFKSWYTPIDDIDLQTGTRTFEQVEEEYEPKPRRSDVLGWIKYLWNS